MFQDQQELMRPIRSDVEYRKLTEAEIKELLGITNDQHETVEELRQKLIKIDRTRSLKMWHDHSEILNHTYVSFMVSTLYDPLLYITNSEYKSKFPDRSPIDVQATIEKPYLYILGQSKSTDADQLSYTSSRIEDLMQLNEPIETNGVQFFDVIRAFSGDGPARQFESGQQRGGHFSCLCGIPSHGHSNLEFAYGFNPPSLAERFHLYKAGNLWTTFSLENPSPFNNLKKDEILEELEARNIYLHECNKKELQEALQTELHGIQRPPALLCTNEINIDDLSQYEIPACEPMHDISNVVQNLITELPAHFPEKSTQKEFEHFSTTTIGDKNQIRGADSRVFAIKLAKFVSTLFQNGKVSEEVFQMCTALVEITRLCYMHFSQRTLREILRLYNQIFKFSYLCKSVIGIPKKMSERKFYGSHFHSLTVHAPQTNRLFCLRSLIPEQEERSFGDLRNISLNTSNRKCGQIIDNAMLRFNAKQKQNIQMDYTRIQESIVSNQAKLLPPPEDTKFSLEFLKNRPTLFQKHCERIADYLLLGEGQWWSTSGSSIFFHDGSSHQSLQEPRLPRLGSITSQKHSQSLKNIWKTCIDNFMLNKLLLPAWKIKIFADGSLQKILKNEELTKMLDSPMESCNKCLHQTCVPAFTCSSSSLCSEAVADNEDDISDNASNDCFEDPCEEEEEQVQCQEEQCQEESEEQDTNQNLGGKNQDAVSARQIGPDHSEDQFNKAQAQDISQDQGGRGEEIQVVVSYQHNDPVESSKETFPARKKSCKRKLFDPNESSDFTQLTQEQQVMAEKMPADKKRQRSEDFVKESMTKKLFSLLSGDPALHEYAKYRKLLKQHPGDQVLRSSYEVALTNLQLAVSRKHTDLKKRGHSSHLQYAEELMQCWGMYYF